jgi:8-oxo-dGTP diphosphatase
VVKRFDCYVVRHAEAGKRGTVADELRPLSRRGREQADAIASFLSDAGITRLYSSAYTRCVDTLEPLAALTGIKVRTRDALAEGNDAAGVLDLVESATAPIALCSHGDVIESLVATLARRGVPLDDDRAAKGSTWVLTRGRRDIVAAHYVPPHDR